MQWLLGVCAVGLMCVAIPAQAAQTNSESKDDSRAKRERPTLRSLAEELDTLKQSHSNTARKVRRLSDDLERVGDDVKYHDDRLQWLLPVRGRMTGYLDLGFFHVQGNGVGTMPDFGNLFLPEFNGQVPGFWVFMGDPLSTAVNARGEPADVGDSRAVTFDPIDNQGRASFILNTLSLNFFGGIGDNATFNAALDIVPRKRNVSDPGGLFLGDFVDVKLAYGEYKVPVDSFQLSFYAGKFDSVLGREYRTQDAPDRLTVSPSLICRYTCGRPIGLKARGGLLDDLLVLNVAVTNGSHIVEMFPFNAEVDTNHGKTFAGRLSTALRKGGFAELGLSGSIGAQDFQDDSDVMHWHYGVDLLLEYWGAELAFEFVQGDAEGETEPGQPECNVSQCLEYKGLYGQIGYRVLNWMVPYVRFDWRDARHINGANFAYITKIWRLTGGVRFEIGEMVVAKAEYTVNREYKPLPNFDNNIFTSSLVLKLF